MNAPLEQRCWNHESREAVCRCPLCGRSFCRECVTEHESRLLCAGCLKAAAQIAGPPRSRIRRAAPVWMTVAGVILAWATFFAAAESLVTITERSESVAWRGR